MIQVMYCDTDMAAEASDSSYEDVLDLYSEWTVEDTDCNGLHNQTVCKLSGDHELAAMLKQSQELDERIAAHCKKKLEERQGPSESPGAYSWVPAAEPCKVSLAEASNQAIVARVPTPPQSTTSRLDEVLKTYWSLPFRDSGSEQPVTVFKASEHTVAERAPLANERTCSTCSKTCDVGKPCWWCGNA